MLSCLGRGVHSYVRNCALGVFCKCICILVVIHKWCMSTVRFRFSVNPFLFFMMVSFFVMLFASCCLLGSWSCICGAFFVSRDFRQCNICNCIHRTFRFVMLLYAMRTFEFVICRGVASSQCLNASWRSLLPRCKSFVLWSGHLVYGKSNAYNSAGILVETVRLPSFARYLNHRSFVTNSDGL